MENEQNYLQNYLTNYRIPIEITKHREELHVLDDGKKFQSAHIQWVYQLPTAKERRRENGLHTKS